MNRVKVFELSKGNQCVMVAGNARSRKGLIPNIGFIIYTDVVIKGEFVDLASQIAFATVEERDRAFFRTTANDIIKRYNQMVSSSNYGLQQIALQSEVKIDSDGTDE